MADKNPKETAKTPKSAMKRLETESLKRNDMQEEHTRLKRNELKGDQSEQVESKKKDN